MKATLTDTRVAEGVPPKLSFQVEIENDSPQGVVSIFGWTGQVFFRDRRKGLSFDFGSLETKLEPIHLGPLNKRPVEFRWEMPRYRLHELEEKRQGEDLSLQIGLNILQFSYSANPTNPPTSISILQGLATSQISVQLAGGRDVTIPKSEWESKLEQLGYGEVFYLELYLPPPPMGTSLSVVLEHIKDAARKFNGGEYSDVLTCCRKSIDDLQKAVGNEQQAKDFIIKMLGDEKKAEAFDDLLMLVQRAKNFASGGPHTYWVKAADRRDAELSLRLTSAIVTYFARNLARQGTS